MSFRLISPGSVLKWTTNARRKTNWLSFIYSMTCKASTIMVAPLRRLEQATVSWTRTLSNTVLNQARVAYQRRVANFTSPDAVNIPSIFTLVDPIGTSLGASSAIPQFFTDNEFQYKDDLSITHGKHNLKSGFEYREFLRGQDAVIREGLLGGVLSCAWPLLNLEDRKPRLSYEGLKTIDGQQLYDLRYRPQRSTDLDIHLYFDPQTFRQ